MLIRPRVLIAAAGVIAIATTVAFVSRRESSVPTVVEAPPAELATAASAQSAPAPVPVPASTAAARPMSERLLRALRPTGRLMPGDSSAQDLARPAVLGERSAIDQAGAPLVPTESAMQYAGSFDGDLRNLPVVLQRRERPEREGPDPRPIRLPGTTVEDPALARIANGPGSIAPAPIANFDGLDFQTFGAGHPLDVNGDVGPTHYIQAINTAVGIFRKSDGVRLAAFTFNTLMSQGSFGNLCDSSNFGDPVVLYDTFEDRWIITDFAFQLDGSGNVINPQGMFQCFAASKTADPVSGGWNFYSINTAGGLGDYGKFGIWPDGLYMSVNMFSYANNIGFLNARVYAFNKAQMYAGASTIQVVSFDLPPAEFSLLPGNARLQAGTPPAGTPNYFTSIWNYNNAVQVWKFLVNWSSIGTSSLTGPTNVVTATAAGSLNTRATTPANQLDTLYPRAMMQNQYSNIGGVESLWNTQTVGAPGVPGQAAVRYYQLPVTGGTVGTTATQAFTYSPESALHRYMVSGAVDRVGSFAMGYSTSDASTHPGIRYAGRLSTDLANSITYTERSIIEGTGSQTATNRWGDYSAMSLDPDGCTFWFTSGYYAVTGANTLTRIASFRFPECTTVSTGTLTGTVRSTAAGTPAIAGAIVTLGSRSTTTNADGVYTFANLPAGTYPSLTAAAPGFTSQTVTGMIVAEGVTTTRDFAEAPSSTSGCFVDTTQAHFESGVSTNCNLTGAPGDLTLDGSPTIDQQNTIVTSSGFAVGATTWVAQTFTPAVTGLATRVDVDLFCFACTGTTPDLTVSLRATSAGLPTGGDLAVGTITGFSSSVGGLFAANFASPITLTSGTQYAVVVRATSNPSLGTYAYVISGSNVYAGGSRTFSVDSGGAWAGDAARDLGFRVYMQTGFSTTGSFVSSIKDANPAAGVSPVWSTISFTQSTPANSALRIQVAGSNNINGPFNFMGPDGGPASAFTSGASLAVFNGLRYLRYQVTLSSSNSSVTPTLSDVSLCYSNPTAPAITAHPQSQAVARGGSVTLSATATGTAPVTYQWYTGTSGSTTSPIGGAIAASYSTGALNATTSFWVRATNTVGTADSDTATVSATIGQPFTDYALVAGATPLRVIHITELRTRIDAQRQRFGLAVFAWTDPSLGSNATSVKAVHITEMRTAIQQAYTAAGVTPPTFTDPTLTPAVSAIKTLHIQELRDAVGTLEVR